jgi:multicomponent Na+:H+ antiporter subunit F
MMDVALNLAALVLLLTLVVGLVRIWRGPAPADRMLASQLFGTTGVALLLVLAETQAVPALRDAALTVAVLAILASVAFVARVARMDRTRGAADRGAPHVDD